MGKEYLTLEQVAEKIQVKERTIKRWIKKGIFPKGRKISRQCVRWSEEFVEEWLDEEGD